MYYMWSREIKNNDLTRPVWYGNSLNPEECLGPTEFGCLISWAEVGRKKFCGALPQKLTGKCPWISTLELNWEDHPLSHEVLHSKQFSSNGDPASLSVIVLPGIAGQLLEPFSDTVGL